MSNAASTPAAPSWRVVSQLQTQMRGPTGAFVPAWHINYQLSTGTIGAIDIPVTTYSAAAVKDAINEAVAEVSTVDTLTSAS
jgi:hypothetical protein